MRRSDEQDGASLRDAPGTSRHDLSEEHIDNVADGVEKHVVFPVHHRIELLLRGRVRRRLRRCRVLGAGVFRHGGRARKRPALLKQVIGTVF